LHIGWSIDTARRRLIIRVPERMTGSAVARAVAGRWRSRPALASYDLIYNLLRFEGDAQNADVQTVKAVYDRLPRDAGMKYTVFVTLDPHFGLWAETMDHQFEDRRHWVADTQLEAEVLLDRMRGFIKLAG
jgi:hypothetical protein